MTQSRDPSETSHGSASGETLDRTGAEMRGAVKEGAQEVKKHVEQTTERARELAADRAEGAIDQTADEIKTASEKAQTLADKASPGSIQHEILSQAADGLSHLSGNLRGKRLSDIASNISDFGRSNPVAFLGGAALIGFAVARLARASQSERDADQRADTEARGPGQSAYRPAAMEGSGQTPSAAVGVDHV